MTEDLSKMEPLLAISNGGISVIHETVAEKLERKQLSPSLIRDINEGCPAAWVAGTYAVPQLIKEEPDTAASRGSLYHKVMEIAFELPAEERTRERIDSIIPEVLESDEFSFFKDNVQALEWLEDAIDGYYEMGGRPRRVQVAKYQRKDDEEPKLGLEVFVKGKLANASRDTLGYIDRLAVDQINEGGVIIEDWKTGAKAKEWNPKTKSTDGLAEARQQVIYSMLLSQTGVNVTGARLIYPVARKMVPIPVDDEKFNKRVLEDVEKADESLTNMIETNLFEYKPSILCSWCPLNKICPVPNNASFEKARLARQKQPSVEDLAPGFDFV